MKSDLLQRIEAYLDAAPSSAAEPEANLQRLLEIRLRLPEYLFTQNT